MFFPTSPDIPSGQADDLSDRFSLQRITKSPACAPLSLAPPCLRPLHIHLSQSPPPAMSSWQVNDLSDRFSLERITKSAAVFDKVKLSWMNGQHLRQMGEDQVCGIESLAIGSNRRVNLMT